MFFTLLRDFATISIKKTPITISNFSNMLIGSGLCYAMESGNYSDIPMILMFPSIYTGYNIYKNRREIYRTIECYK